MKFIINHIASHNSLIVNSTAICGYISFISLLFRYYFVKKIINLNNKLIKISRYLLLVLLLGNNVWAVDNSSDETVPDAIPEFDCVIEPSEIVDVGSAVPGLIEIIHARRNDFVEKGTIIAKLESSVELATTKLTKERASLNTSIHLRKENVEFSLRTQERNKPLFKQSNISEQGMDKFDTETRIAKLQVQQEKENKRIAELEHNRAEAILQRRTIKSSVDGVVVKRYKSAGEYVEDDPIIRVAQIDPLHVHVVISLDHLGDIKPGMQANVIADIPGAETHIAHIERVDRVADAASGTFGARLNLSNTDYSIPAGVRCRLVFQSEVTDQDKNVVVNENELMDVDDLAN